MCPPHLPFLAHPPPWLSPRPPLSGAHWPLEATLSPPSAVCRVPYPLHTPPKVTWTPHPLHLPTAGTDRHRQQSQVLTSVPPQTVNSWTAGGLIPTGPPAPSLGPGPQVWITELSTDGAPTRSTSGAGCQPTNSPCVLQRQQHPYLAPAGAAKNSPQDSALSWCQPLPEARMCPLSIQAPFPISPIPAALAWAIPGASSSYGQLLWREANRNLQGNRPGYGEGTRDRQGRWGGADCGESGVPGGVPTGHRPGALEETPNTTWGSGSVRALSVQSDRKPEVERAEPCPANRGLGKGGPAKAKEAVFGVTPHRGRETLSPPSHCPVCARRTHLSPSPIQPHLAALAQPRQVGAPAGEQTK